MRLFKRRSGKDRSSGQVSAADDVLDDGAEGSAVDTEGLIQDSGEAAPGDATSQAATSQDATSQDATAGGPASGPYDVDAAPDHPRLDLGALQLPLVEGAEVQLQVDEASSTVTAAMVVLGDSAVQLQAFAAPRSEGIWAEVSEEIAAGISQQGGTADASDGPFGRELLGRVPAQLPDGKVGFQPMRFVGVDGPRWLLRAVFHGRAAIEPTAAEALENLVRGVVVVRGVEPMGPRELLALRLPEGAQRVDPATGAVQPDEQPDEQPRSADDLNPFERGPEITEIR